jgi:hypothetical protein
VSKSKGEGDVLCLVCKQIFHRKLMGRRLCDKCLKKYVAVSSARERASTLSPAQVELRMNEMILNETRMPWERTKP